ncbi:LacI family DNA-binding transcriptional regulator [Photobacterium sp. DA100]|uniref:LacI family DNA-binding transcriptional regulator n=1 Tax=Photobacterium sp. DA100 TaxID=3027472 RepID=UPI00247956C2|nr:LacI family DNA-binding transcriptional regulator [Photobacterium sp. DA100]WEM41131.1 LacI family DNA-binding transcriptional regulator [Photobacterium sp. DA100]
MSIKKRITMRDIASAAGVSQPTVSLVLNGSQSIKLAEATKKKVLDAAQKLGYEHKRASHSKGRPKKIALVINGLNHYDPFIEAVNAAREAAWQQDRVLVTFDYSNDKLLAAQIQNEIEQGEYDGLIYASSMTRALSPNISIDAPTVLLNCYCKDHSDLPSILPADKLGAYKVTEHLLAQGYHRIGMICGEKWMDASTDRLNGYRQALINNDIIPDEALVKEGNWSLKEAHQQTLALLDLPNPPEAIFIGSDYMAIGCYQAIAERGLSIPGDIALVSFDNQQVASEFTPGLTSVELPYSDMGRQSVETLIELVNKQPLMSPTIKVEGDVIVRESSVRQ